MNLRSDLERSQLEKLRQQRYEALSRERTIEKEEAKRKEMMKDKFRWQ